MQVSPDTEEIKESVISKELEEIVDFMCLIFHNIPSNSLKIFANLLEI